MTTLYGSGLHSKKAAVGGPALLVSAVLTDAGNDCKCDLPLPEISGTGAVCSLIFSQKLTAATVHLNTALSRTRDRANGRFVGVFVEGNDGTLRPAMEVFAERDNHGGRTNSVLLGAIWKKSEARSFDAGLGCARSKGENLSEIRVGLTWTLPARKGS
jgi:hypothetical protein